VTDDGVGFRVWAPAHEEVAVVCDAGQFPLEGERGGYFSGVIKDARAGTRYKYRLGNAGEFPDPVSRFQPEGPHGPSEVIDPGAFVWTDSAWQGVPLERAVIYEMHIGTFTDEGSWRAATAVLPELKKTGITVIEVMPVAEFTGRFGWGYDGVQLFAPTRLYGRPDDFRHFVDTAHSLGMAVILDVVYNHLGADGNYLAAYSPTYFSNKYSTDWGDAINFDLRGCEPVREFFISNAGYWMQEYHLDGLRLDATQNIYDDSDPHILVEVARRVREAAPGRVTLLVGENEPQNTTLVRPEENGGYGLDALWNDDLHHSAVVALTGKSDAYYTDYSGSAQEFVSAAKFGFLYQGQRYKWQKKRRGTSTRGLKPSAFVTFIENHDQVANSAWGDRIHHVASPGKHRAMTAFILLGPGTPMLFQGQEFGSSRRFRYFADVPEKLCDLVREGRKEFLRQWRSIRTSEMSEAIEDPCTLQAFEQSKLDQSERERHLAIYSLHIDLLKLRREDPVFSNWSGVEFDGAVLTSEAFVLRAFGDGQSDRLLIVNLGRDLHLNPAPEPLLAPPADCQWNVLFSTDDPRYGGVGTAPLETEENWRIPGNAAVAMQPGPQAKPAAEPSRQGGEE
jgi:maltooligosyltrehalose trehalohydrolase